MSGPNLRFGSYNGSEISSQFEALGKLRIQVFRAFPYLYEGDLDYEMAYLKTYAAAARSLLFCVFDGDEMVGATTCIPLLDETVEVKAPFVAAGLDLEQIFYFGESILLPNYRGHGLGHRFFDVREAHAAAFGSYGQTCFCAVDRPADHALRPQTYLPLDAFWQGRGYQKMPALTSQFEWLDIGETESTAKTMIYWMRNL